ncbi:MAG: hypothetical protein QGH24_03545, partial [Candidatus Marinimicrobia bacterium]|nr:hypothetical protein [Candidatus Neomarinimicrobiota bacterium]
TILLMICSAFVAVNMQSISKAWEFIFAMGAGIGLVLILRWFWWRINAWTEISALLTSIVITIIFELIAWQQTISTGNGYMLFDQSPVLFGISLQIHHKLLIIVPSAVLVWLTVTFFTKPESTETLTRFYERVHPGGWWNPIASKVQSTFSPVTNGFFLNWIAGVCFIHGLTFAIGHWLFGNTIQWLILFSISAGGFIYLWYNLIQKLND